MCLVPPQQEANIAALDYFRTRGALVSIGGRPRLARLRCASSQREGGAGTQKQFTESSFTPRIYDFALGGFRIWG